MSTENGFQAFKNENAANFDKQREKLAPLKDALHLIMQAAFSALADDARVLCVGAGTGAEVFNLALAFPGWRFTVIEPEADMIAICREKAEQQKLTARCEFHQGFLDSYQGSTDFDAATAILVSHFITDRQKRIDFFSAITRHLRKGGLFVNADLSGNPATPSYLSSMAIWQAMNQRAGIQFSPEAFANRVAISPISEIEEMLRSSGFSDPLLIYRALFIHAWVSRVE